MLLKGNCGDLFFFMSDRQALNFYFKSNKVVYHLKTRISIFQNVHYSRLPVSRHPYLTPVLRAADYLQLPVGLG